MLLHSGSPHPFLGIAVERLGRTTCNIIIIIIVVGLKTGSSGRVLLSLATIRESRCFAGEWLYIILPAHQRYHKFAFVMYTRHQVLYVPGTRYLIMYIYDTVRRT